MDLFEHAWEKQLEREAPLAARMRPRTLEEFVGQDHIVGPGRLLRRAIGADRLGSLIFYGPPGTGKTTLAQVIANTTRAHFASLNAVLAGVKDIRAAIDEARERGSRQGRRTILFVDEVHRFNKAQQDALLPWVENGTVIFIGATTENPFFEVNKALVSRSRVFQLTPLTSDDLRRTLRAAIEDPDRGYGRLEVEIDDDALEHLVDVASGDARAALNALELAVETTAPEAAAGDGPGRVQVTLEVAEESIQRRAVLYDKEGDYHFDTISAFIKSLRGSDPDAALYWLAKMVYAGESPRFIFRRMLILASEDVGMAAPEALGVVVACAQAFEQVGMPEGRFHLAQAALHLAAAPKSNSTLGFFDALDAVSREADSGVPAHLRDPSRDAEGFGHGQGYLYPHAYRDHWVAQQYLPGSLQGKLFYQPSNLGAEASIRREVERRREAQLAAMVEVGAEGGPIEALTFSRRERAVDQWLQRTVSRAGELLGAMRDRVLDEAGLARHGRLLDLKAGSGLLTWEALRRAPEGGVWSLARSPRDADALRGRAQQLPELERPVVLEGGLEQLEALALAEPELLFDAVVGHNALVAEPDKAAALAAATAHLAPGGVLSLAEGVPRHTQRLADLIDLTPLDQELTQRLRLAEEAIYDDPDDPMVSWDASDLLAAAAAAGLEATADPVEASRQVVISAAVLERWFDDTPGDRLSFGQRLALLLTPEELTQVRALFSRQLRDQTVTWSSRLVYLKARRL